MKTMLEYLEEVFNKSIIRELGFLDGICKLYDREDFTFEEIINDDELCLELISRNLDFKSKNFQINKAYKYRFKHIVICWVMGIGFMEYAFADNKSAINNMRVHMTWLLTAFTHDYGWFCDEVFINPADIKLLSKFGDYYLLTDTYSSESLKALNGYKAKHHEITPREYSEIEDYYNESISYHEEEKINNPDAFDPETCDHGVVGACVAFKEYIEYIENTEVKSGRKESNVLKEINKEACLLTASHNMFGFEVYKENILLSQLSLVDTIEATKKFRIHNVKTNKVKRYIPENSVLLGTRIEVNADMITIDLSNLREYINTKRKTDADIFIDCLEGYKNNLASLKEWTGYDTEVKDDAFQVVITKKVENEKKEA